MLCYAKSLQSCPTLCDPIDSSPPGSPVPGILQARTLERVAISFSNAWKWKVKVKSLSRVTFQKWARYEKIKEVTFCASEFVPWEQQLPTIYLLCMFAWVLSCVWLCNPMDCSLPGYSVHGISQVIILEWVALSSSRGSSWAKDRTYVSCVSSINRRVLYHWAT